MTRSLLVTGRTYGEKVLPNRILRFKSGVEKRGDWKEVGPAAERGLLGLCPKHCAPGHVASRRPPRSQISEGRRAPAPLSTEAAHARAEGRSRARGSGGHGLRKVRQVLPPLPASPRSARLPRALELACQDLAIFLIFIRSYTFYNPRVTIYGASAFFLIKFQILNYSWSHTHENHAI